MKFLKKKIIYNFLKFKLKKNNLIFRYFGSVYFLFIKQKNLIIPIFNSIENNYAKIFFSNELKLDRGIYNFKELLRPSFFLLISLITNFFLSLVNLIALLVVIETDFLLNGFFIYKNPFLKNLILNFIKIFFIGNFLYFLPLSYSLLMLVGYMSFYIGIVLILLFKKQYKECFEFIGTLYLQKKKNIILQTHINNTFFFFCIQLFKIKNETAKKKQDYFRTKNKRFGKRNKKIKEFKKMKTSLIRYLA